MIRKQWIFWFFAGLTLLSVFGVSKIRFSFDFEQFFPKGDPELEFFNTYREKFERDDNFMLIAFTGPNGAFDQELLQQIEKLCEQAPKWPEVLSANSLTTMEFPVFRGIMSGTRRAIRVDRPERYARDSARIMRDERLVRKLIADDGRSMVVALKTVDSVSMDIAMAATLMDSLNAWMEQEDVPEYHYLGFANMVDEMVQLQKSEFAFSSVVALVLVLLVMFLVFRTFWGVTIALVSIGLGMLIFAGILGLWGRELDAMSALYPILMIIVGTSDVVHIMSKYIDELHRGKSKKEAMDLTVREIGMATFLTSATTAIGFCTLLTSKIPPIPKFGVNAAIGVLVAYLTVLFFTTSWLARFRRDQIIKERKGLRTWDRLLGAFHQWNFRNSKAIGLASIAAIGLCFWGISMVTTNYTLESNLPLNNKLTDDFHYFEEHYSGFRPVEWAVLPQGDYKVDDYQVLEAVSRLEDQVKTYEVYGAPSSLVTLYKSMNKALHGDADKWYVFPDKEEDFAELKNLAEGFGDMGMGNVLVSEDGKWGRVSTFIQDVGADSNTHYAGLIEAWVAKNVDSSIVKFRTTGTAIIIDKNTEYARSSLVQGLGIAVLLISLLMGFLFRNPRMVIVSLVPNVFPLLVAGALLGFLGIPFDAGLAIIFAIVFGIAVDDTIHFLSKYKLCQDQGLSVEESLRLTITETGKAIILTSLILFAGFLILLTSSHLPTVHTGLLISLTLLSALVADLLWLPPLIRWLMPDKNKA